MDFGNGTSNAKPSSGSNVKPLTVSVESPVPASTEWHLISGAPPMTSSDSVADDESSPSNQYVMPRIDSDIETDNESGIRTRVTVEQINAKSMEYDRIEQQIQEMAVSELRIQEQLEDDQKKFKMQIKQTGSHCVICNVDHSHSLSHCEYSEEST